MPVGTGFGKSGSAAGDRLFGSADILSDSPSRHIPVPLSANPRPRCRLGTLLPRLRIAATSKSAERGHDEVARSPSPVGARRHSWRAMTRVLGGARASSAGRGAERGLG
ncbi:hypothetical protein XarbCFBP8132_03730 [Xanthomonas arboricola]|nr:hypothetical protein XarbCFBP8132_03730 [Xanthomonas arboricola]